MEALRIGKGVDAAAIEAQVTRPADKYQLFDALAQEEYEALKADIRERGVLVPVELDEQGNILDGHHRVRAWNELKAEGVDIADYLRVIRPGLSEEQKRNHVRALNILRRHLSKEQRVKVWTDMRADGATYQQIAAATGVSIGTVHNAVSFSNLKNSDETPTTVTGKDGKQYPASKPRKAATPAIVAKSDKQVEQTVKTLDRLENHAPEVYERVIESGISDPQLIQLINDKRQSETVQDFLASGVLQPGEEDEATPGHEASAWDLQGLLREKNQEHRRRASDERKERKLAQIDSAPGEVFSVVYADPAWEYDNSGLYGAAERHYPTMTVNEICALPGEIGLKVADTAVLFLWATNPLLPDALRVMQAWGFDYKTNIAWDKERATTGLGFYVRGQHELLLIGTRNNFQPITIFNSLFRAEKGAHSAKPYVVYSMIETMYPRQRYVELFARNATPRTNWTFWGNEADGLAEAV